MKSALKLALLLTTSLTLGQDNNSTNELGRENDSPGDPGARDDHFSPAGTDPSPAGVLVVNEALEHFERVLPNSSNFHDIGDDDLMWPDHQ